MLRSRRSESGEIITTDVRIRRRAGRRDYVRRSLVAPRNRFAGFFLDLFRREPNPFLASPTATWIDRRTKLEKQARLAAKRTTYVDWARQALRSQGKIAVGERLRAAEQVADDELDPRETGLEEERQILIENRPSVIKSRLEQRLNDVVVGVNADVGRTAASLARYQVKLEKFIDTEAIDSHAHWGKAMRASTVWALVAVTFGEFLLNTLFFSGSQRTGIIGGAGLAFLLSVVTIILGIELGRLYQFTHARAPVRIWTGRLGIPLLLVVILFYLLLLTLARIAGEHGSTDMFADAARMFQQSPLSGLLDLPAFLYLIFSIFVIGLVAYKFVDVMGHIPKFRAFVLAARDAEDEFDDAKRDKIDEARDAIEEELEALDLVPMILRSTTIPIKKLVMNYENIVAQYYDDVADVKDAHALLLSVAGRYVGSSQEDAAPDFDAANVALDRMEARLADFMRAAQELQNWEPVSDATIEQCRHDMAKLGADMIRTIEKRCDQVGRERYDEARQWAERSAAVRQQASVSIASEGLTA